MKKHEILYDWPIAQVQHLADSTVAETYAEGLDAAPLAAFTTLTEQIRGLGADLAAAKEAAAAKIADAGGVGHFAKWSELRQCLEEFEHKFGSFPNSAIPKFRLFVILSDKLAQIAQPLDDVDVAENAFEIRTLPHSLPLSWFARENVQSERDSTAVFTCDDPKALEEQILLANLSPKFLFYLLAALYTLPVLPAGHVAFVKKTMPQIDITAIDAFVRMTVIATGKPVHSARKYLNAPCVLEIDAIRPGHVYQQWLDVLTVLSEYNSRDEVLLKYLTIYHVIENFMFKLPIVGLERQQAGRMFSIRDFRRLYEQVNISESDALKQLFTVIFRIDAKPGVTFQQNINTRWNALLSCVPQGDIDKALADLGLSLTFAGFQAQTTAGGFSKLVYAIRNAIVHNKETEFHLTYASLDANVCSLIEVFLIPALEEVCFSLIGSPNTQLWYKNREILLYK